MTGLIIHSLKSKKNWFFLNIAICIVFAVILPILFKSSYEFFAITSLVIASIIIVISIFSDLVFLHDDRKVSYYLSKPISLNKKINIALISNVIFCTITLLVTFLISSSAGTVLSKVNYSYFLKGFSMSLFIIYAWLMLIISVVTLSTVLTGNTTVSVLVSIFNFTLPLILYFIASYIFYILDTLVVGIGTNVMSEIFLERVLPLEKIYFLDYLSLGHIDIFYFIRLICFCAVIYAITLLFIKYRKNERTGDFVVHTIFKYFMSLFASLIFPMIMTMIISGANLVVLITVMVLLSALSYYIIIAALNKSFRISLQAFKIYLPFIVLIIIFIFSSAFVIREKEKYIPNAEDIKAVYIGEGLSYLKNRDSYDNYIWDSLVNAKYEDVKDNKNIILLDDVDNIKNIIEVQNRLISMKKVDYYSNIYIIYYMNNGKKVVREYHFPRNFNDNILGVDNSNIFENIMDIMKTDDYIDNKYYAYTDEDYINSMKIRDAYLYKDDEEKILLNFDYAEFAECYMEDYRNFINNSENMEKITYRVLDFSNLNYIDDEVYYDGDISTADKPEKEDSEKIIELIYSYSLDGKNIKKEFLTIHDSMIKTREYLNSLK